MIPDSAELAGRLRLAVGRLGRQLRYQQIGGLTPSQLSALSTVEKHGPLRLSGLACHENVSVATMSRCIAALESQELLQRRADPDDRRSALLVLTPSGSQLLDGVRREHTTLLAHRIGALTPEQQRILTTALPVLEILLNADTQLDGQAAVRSQRPREGAGPGRQ